MTLDEHQAFEAMRRFLVAYWERGGRQTGDLAGLLGDVSTGLWADDTPNDPAQWTDWLAAVESVLSEPGSTSADIKRPD